MYWPTTTARRLHLSPAGLHAHGKAVQDDQGDGAREAKSAGDQAELYRIVHLACSSDSQLWASLTADTLSVWSVRPAHILAALVRTPKSLQEYGANTRLRWSPDGLGIVVETDASYLLLYSLRYLPQRQAHVYSYVPSTGSGARSKVTKELLAPAMSTLRSTFASGPGEGSDLGEGRRLAIDIRFKLVLRIDAGLSGSVATDDYLVVSTCSPPAIQCIPWPEDPSNPTSPPGEKAKKRAPTRTSVLSRLDWLVRATQSGPSEDTTEDANGGEEALAAAGVQITSLSYSQEMDVFVWITSDGRAYCANVRFDSRTSIWRGRCFHGLPSKRRRSSAVSLLDKVSEGADQQRMAPLPSGERACCAAINARFSLLAVGKQDGTVSVYTFRAPDKAALYSHSFSVRVALRSTASYLSTGHCTSLAWSSDGHALAVAWERGWSVWSTYGKLMGCSLTENWQDASRKFSDAYMRGVKELFWGPGNTELFLLCDGELTKDDEQDGSRDEGAYDVDRQLFVLPFAKSAVANQHSPDNTRYAFVQLDDSVLVYRGSDQPDMSIINPESDVWHHIKIPQSYLAANWPVRYACISSDGRLIAVAGQRGLTHFSTLSGRWKQFQQTAQEQRFVVEGGLQWYQHVLVAACHFPETDEYQIRLYSRDLNLDETSVLYIEHLPSPVVLTSLFDNSLLVYTADNTLHHFLIAITNMEIRLTLCGSITFEGVVGEPTRVRGMSWLVPPSQQQFGDPMDDLMMATIIFLIDGKLVLLRPRRSSNNDDEEEVSYDMQILADQIEYYWTHLQGVGTLENSLWGYDGRGIKLWLDALTIEQADVLQEAENDEDDKPEYRTIAESLSIPLDFYPLCVLIEKGIIIGVDPEVSLRRSLEFAIFRSTTNTQLFVQHVLRNYLERRQMREAVLFATFYRPLVYFAHALEILLHDVLEEEADSISPSTGPLPTSSSSGSIIEYDSAIPASALPNAQDTSASMGDNSVTSSLDGDQSMSPASRPAGKKERGEPLLPVVVAFLDHFDECLDVVVNCARKTEVARWSYLFSVVGDPRELFEVCLERGNYKAAGSYLLVLHNLDTLEVSQTHTVRLLTLARQHGWLNLCKDLLRFTRSLDDDGRVLRAVVTEAGLIDEGTRKGSISSTSTATAENHSPLLSPIYTGLSAPSGTLQRTASAPSILDTAIAEEDEEEEEEVEEGEEEAGEHTRRPNGTMNRSLSSASPSPSKPSIVQRSSSLFASAPDSTPPRPSLGINGRILPAATPPDIRRSSVSNGSGINGGHSRRVSSGLGMSLSKVGLRSTEHVWDSRAASATSPSSQRSPPTSPSTAD